LPVTTAQGTIHRLFEKAELKPEKGRAGPRPYDLRHRADFPIMPTFVVERAPGALAACRKSA